MVRKPGNVGPGIVLPQRPDDWIPSENHWEELDMLFCE